MRVRQSMASSALDEEFAEAIRQCGFTRAQRTRTRKLAHTLRAKRAKTKLVGRTITFTLASHSSDSVGGRKRRARRLSL